MWRSALAKMAGKLALDYQMTSDIEAVRHTRLSTTPTLTVNMNRLERRLITAEIDASSSVMFVTRQMAGSRSENFERGCRDWNVSRARVF